METDILTRQTASAASSSEKFSIRRLTAYFELYILSNSKKLLLSCIMMFAVTFVMQILIYYMSINDIYEAATQMKADSMEYDPMWSANTKLMTFLLIGFSILAGSKMFSAISSRSERHSTLQLPASQLEKFLTWLTIYLPLFLITLFACFYIAEICRVLWIAAFTDYARNAHIMPLKFLLTLTSYDPQSTITYSGDDTLLIAFTFCGAVVNNAVYALGSVLFPKLSLLKTFGIYTALIIIYGTMASLGIETFLANGGSSRIDSGTDAIIIVVGISAAICIYLYRIAYARYKESEIINRW